MEHGEEREYWCDRRTGWCEFVKAKTKCVPVQAENGGDDGQ